MAARPGSGQVDQADDKILRASRWSAGSPAARTSPPLSRPSGLPAQSVMTRTTTVLTGIETGPLPAEVFQVDPGYTEQRPPWIAGGD